VPDQVPPVRPHPLRLVTGARRHALPAGVHAGARRPVEGRTAALPPRPAAYAVVLPLGTGHARVHRRTIR
jgi:hypothetical protein